MEFLDILIGIRIRKFMFKNKLYFMRVQEEILLMIYSISLENFFPTIGKILSNLPLLIKN